MKVYDCFGTFDPNSKSIRFAVQTTQIGFDTFTITKYYDISNATRFALLAILETKKGNDYDLSACKPDSAMIADEIPFSRINREFLKEGDKKISEITAENKVDIYILHAIGFDPTTVPEDRENIELIKSDTGVNPISLAKGSPPSKAGKKGVLSWPN